MLRHAPPLQEVVSLVSASREVEQVSLPDLAGKAQLQSSYHCLGRSRT